MKDFNLSYSPLTVGFMITGTPEQLLKVKDILSQHNLKVEILEYEEYEELSEVKE